MSIALIALLPLVGALLAPMTIRFGRNACAATAGAASLAAFALLMSFAPGVYSGEVVRQEIAWLPRIGLSFSFFVDGLGFFFATLILGIGLLIILYARYYLARQDPMGRFYAYLLLFQSAMLGIALSDNALLFLIFWEMTSLSSFLLIGYWRHLPEGRQGAPRQPCRPGERGTEGRGGGTGRHGDWVGFMPAFGGWSKRLARPAPAVAMDAWFPRPPVEESATTQSITVVDEGLHRRGRLPGQRRHHPHERHGPCLLGRAGRPPRLAVSAGRDHAGREPRGSDVPRARGGDRADA
jgi:hypothetical protein